MRSESKESFASKHTTKPAKFNTSNSARPEFNKYSYGDRLAVEVETGCGGRQTIEGIYERDNHLGQPVLSGVSQMGGEDFTFMARDTVDRIMLVTPAKTSKTSTRKAA